MDLSNAIQTQFHAALTMLERAVDACPDTLWDDATYTNRFWHIAYLRLVLRPPLFAKVRKTFVPGPNSDLNTSLWAVSHGRYTNHSAIKEAYSQADIREYIAEVVRAN